MVLINHSILGEALRRGALVISGRLFYIITILQPIKDS
jgi:hypothetical protein